MATTLQNRPAPNNDDSEEKIVRDLLREGEQRTGATNDSSTFRNLMQEQARADAEEASQDANEDAEDDAVADRLHGAESTVPPANDTIGSGYKPNGDNAPGKKRKFLTVGNVRKLYTRQWLAGGVITLILAGSLVGLLSIASGPAQLLHAAALGLQTQMDLNNYIMKIDVGKTIQYARTVENPEQRNMGFIGNKLADYYTTKLKAEGLTPHYTNNRITSFTIDTKTEAGKRAVDNMLKEGVPDTELVPGKDGKISLDVDRTKSTSLRRAIVSGMVKSVGMNKVVSAIGGRVMRVRAGVNWHINNMVRNKDEDIKNYRDRVNKEKTEEFKNGTKGAAGTVASEDNANADDKNAGADNQQANDAAGAANDIMDEAKGNAPADVKVKNLRAKFTAGVGVTGLLATVCGVRALGDAVGDQRYANIVAPLTRMGMYVPILGSQMEEGNDVNADQIGVTVSDMYDPATKTSWIDGASVQAARNVDVTGPDLPDAAKPGGALKPQFFIVIDKIVDAIPGFGSFCGLVGTTAGGWILSAVGVAATATGPVSLILNAASEAAQQLLANAFLDDLVRWLAGSQVNPLPKGAEWGNTMMYGLRLASNDISISQGGVELSNAQEAQWTTVLNDVRQTENKHESLYAKYLQVDNPNSLVAKALFETPAINTTANDPGYAMASLAKAPMGILSSLGNSMSTILSPKASAAGKTFDYGFSKYGQTLDTLDDPDLQDPYANADKVEPRLAEFNEKYGTPCFNRTVDPTTFELKTEPQMKRYDQIADQCKDGNDQDLKEYGFYLRSMVAGKIQLCMLDIDTSACPEVGYGTTNSSDDTASTTATNTIDIKHLFDPSTDVACATGTRDLGTADGYHDGNKMEIRLCAVPNIKCPSSAECNGGQGVKGANGQAVVNSRVSGVYYAMAAQAAKEDLPLYANSSFRSMAHQQALWNDNPNPSRVARPGTSNHQAGVAIDFGNSSGSAIKSGDKYFVWLTKNANSYGLENYKPEAWHWSPTGN